MITMKLIQLTCDKPSFRTLRFRPEGVNLIIGDGSKEKDKEGSSNGVGKTVTSFEIRGTLSHDQAWVPDGAHGRS